MDAFLTDFLASMEGKTAKEYVSDHENLLARVAEMQTHADNAKVETLEDYQKFIGLYHLISGTFCYALNSNQPYDAVVTAEKTIWNKLYKFCNSYNRLSGKLLSAGKYICWSKYYRSFSEAQEQNILNALKGFIFQREGRYYLVGMHLSVRDNTCHYSRTGQRIWDYVRTLGFQALPINGHFSKLIDSTMKDSVPQLPEMYEIVTTGNYRGSIKLSVSYDTDLENVREISNTSA